MQVQFKCLDGLRFFRERLYIPEASGLQQSFLNEFHSFPLGGHPGIKATLA